VPFSTGQKEFGLSDHLFKVVFNTKKTNHVLLLTSILGAIKEVVSWCLTLFKHYYVQRQIPGEFETQAYLKITEKRLEVSFSSFFLIFTHCCK
jgi:hypothetical protein